MVHSVQEGTTVSDYDALRAERLAAVSSTYRAMIDRWPELSVIGVEGYAD